MKFFVNHNWKTKHFRSMFRHLFITIRTYFEVIPVYLQDTLLKATNFIVSVRFKNG